MSRLHSLEPPTPGKRLARGLTVAVLLTASCVALSENDTVRNGSISLELTPRICTVHADQNLCETKVTAQWHSDRDESLCLVIVDRPEVKHCWESFSRGTYSLQLTFGNDMTFQLKDPDLKNTLASETLRLIREAQQYRQRRRAPWNVFE
jgi:Protein of unknown function (DUF3019)